MNKKTPTYKNLRDNIRNRDKKLKDRDKEIVKLQKQLAAAREENTELLRHSRTEKQAFNRVISDTKEEAKKKIEKAETLQREAAQRAISIKKDYSEKIQKEMKSMFGNKTAFEIQRFKTERRVHHAQGK